MRFAKTVFIAAGVWGIVVLTPLYFLLDVTGRQEQLGLKLESERRPVEVLVIDRVERPTPD